MQHAPEVTLPRTAADALGLWEAGKPVPAFRVESEGASQPSIWEWAFELISRGNGLMPGARAAGCLLTARERAVAQEIAKACTLKDRTYAQMVQIQLAGGGEPIFVTKTPVAPSA